MQFLARRVLLFTLWLLPSFVASQEKELVGTLRTLDLDAGVITVARPPKGQTQTFSLLRKDIPITNVRGAGVKAADLKKHDRIAFAVTKDEDVVAIRCESDLEWGVVTHVHPERDELIAQMNHTPRSLRIAPNVRVQIDGAAASAADLKVVKPWSHGVKIQLTPDRSGIQEMWIQRAKYHFNPYNPQLTHAAAFLTHHDPAKKTLTLVTTDRYQPFELSYDGWTQLRLVSHFKSLRDVPIGELRSPAKVNVVYHTDSKLTASVSIELPSLSRRRIAVIDRNARTLAVAASEEHPAETFVFAPEVHIVRDGKETHPLADLKDTYLVTLGLSLDQKEILYLSYVER